MAATKGPVVPYYRDPLSLSEEEHERLVQERKEFLRPTPEQLPSFARRMARAISPSHEYKPKVAPEPPPTVGRGDAPRLEPPGELQPPGQRPSRRIPAGGGLGGLARGIRKAGQMRLDPGILGGIQRAARTTETQLGQLKEMQQQREFVTDIQANRMALGIEAREKIVQEQEKYQQEALQRRQDLQMDAKFADRPASVSLEDVQRTQQRASQGIDPDTGQDLTPKEQQQARRALDKWSQIKPDISTGRKIAATIAMAIGGYLAATGKGPNSAANLMRDIIDQDIAEQKARFAAAKGRLAEHRTAWAMANEAFKDRLAQNEATRAIMYDQTAMFLQTQALQMENMQAQQQVQELEQEFRMNAQQLFDSAQDRDVRARIAEGQLRLGKAQLQQRAALEEAKPGLRVPYGTEVIPGAEQNVAPEDFKRLKKDVIAPYNSIVSALDRMQELRTTKGAEVAERWIVREAKQNAAIAQGATRILLNFGARLEDREAEALEALVAGDPTEIGFIIDAIGSSKDLYLRYTNAQLQPSGIRLTPPTGPSPGATLTGEED